MSAQKKNCNGQSVFLFLYSSESYFRKRQIVYSHEETKLEIDGEILGISAPFAFTIKRAEDGWLIDGKQIGKGGYCFLQNNNNEQVLLVPVIPKDTLACCGRIAFGKEATMTVGSDFRQDIFYEYASFIGEKVLHLYREKNDYYLETNSEEKGQKIAAVYVNGKAVSGKILLHKGDNIVMLGLSVLVLPDMLLCTSFFGTLRIAERSNLRLAEKREGHWGRKLSGKECYVEEIITESETLHQEELELELPLPERKEHMQPLILTIGPSATMTLPVILMAALGSVAGQSSYYLITVAMTAASAFLSVFWGLINYHYRKYAGRKEEAQRKESYRRYLQDIRQYLESCREENRRILLNRNPNYKSFISDQDGCIRVRYGRGSDSEELWFARLGLGPIPFQVKIKLQNKNRILLQDILQREAYAIADEYGNIEGVPVGITLDKDKRIGFVGTDITPLLLQLLLQLAAGHEADTLKIIYFYHEEYREESMVAECIKWLPHLWQRGRKLRFLAGNKKEAGELLPSLTEMLERQREEQKKVLYLFVIANQTLIEGERVSRYLAEEYEGTGICACYVGQERRQIPGDCTCLVLQDKREILCQCKDVISRQQADWEVCDSITAKRYMRHMAGVRQLDGNAERMQEQVSFLDLFVCERVEDLGCQSRWQENRTGERMRVPIGIGEDGKGVFLDIHEKFHGPHGLVAGTTGAGKSELLQTYLLSLAVSFSPDDVNFFIIDYKGGGMGDVLSRLPHCSGIISNLSGRQIKRALASIKSENRRRQRLLHQNKVSHIEEYKELYREGIVSEPMPHLILVVDEFAELKKEEPEFMQEIISMSQVGRSLGVHLILATQKPAGCVDDKIWSNTRFRLCLRVADKQDSMDMLHKPEAAFLTGAGKGYMQVGNDELFVLFQAGYCKAPYLPRSKERSQTAMISATGYRTILPREKSQKQPRQLECIMNYIQDTAERLFYEPVRSLWMPELSETIILDEEMQRGRSICIGICDDPKQQRQFPCFYNPEEDGHLCLCGGPATGKSTFLQTFLWQLCMRNSPHEAQFLLVASDAAGVNCFEQMPHCLGSMKKDRDAECFFYHLKLFFEQRKELLGGISFAQYQKRQSEKIPILFLVIDNYGSFRRMTQDAYEELIEKLAGEGINYGIYLIITALGAGGSELPAKLFEKIKSTMALELSDRVLYGDVLRRYQLDVLPKNGCKGRGLCRVGDAILEMQVPLFTAEDDYIRIEEVERQCRILQKREGSSIEKFPYIPEKASYEMLFERFEAKKHGKKLIPLGYIRKSGLIETLSFNRNFPFVITGGPHSGKKSLLLALLYGCHKAGMKVALLDSRQEISLSFSDMTIFSDAQELESWYQEEAWEAPVVLGICNLADFARSFAYRGEMPGMIIVSRPEEELSLLGNQWYEQLLTKQCGICLGGNAGNQRILSFEDLGYEHMSRSKPPGYGYYKSGVGQATGHLYLPVLGSHSNRKKESEE